MAPIRVGLIGLPAVDSSQIGPGCWGVQAHLKPLQNSPHYEIVAVCNSSVESSQRAIDFHKLPASIKAYGSPEDLANDPDVDLVAVSVNVGKHLMLSKPALLKNKDVFVEWPLGASLKEAEELTQLAKDRGVKTIVGVQFRADPLLLKIKEVIASGAIGKVTSSIVSAINSLPSGIWFHDATYYLSMESGGNEFMIAFGHCKSICLMLVCPPSNWCKVLDGFTNVLGDFKTTQSTLKTHNPTVSLVDLKTGEVINPSYPKTAPDHIFVQGELESGALVSIAFRKSDKAIDSKVGLRWTITGTEGEIEITFPPDQVQFGSTDRSFRVRTSKDETVQVVSFAADEASYVKEVPYPGTNTARIYEAFAKGDDCYATFESSLKTHELLDKLARDAKYL